MEVPHEDIEAVSWQSVPAGGHIWVYVPLQSCAVPPVLPCGIPGEGLPDPDAAFPMLQSYIDVFVEGGLEYGPDFAQELIETTADWSRYWLNDRELARRSWVRDAKSAEVDRLLATTTPANARLPLRLFAEPYAVRWGRDNGHRRAQPRGGMIPANGRGVPQSAAIRD